MSLRSSGYKYARKIRNGLPSSLLDASVGGIGVSVSTPLTVGLTIAARGKFGESRKRASDVGYREVVRRGHEWRLPGRSGVSRPALISRGGLPRLSTKLDEELNHYELLQVSPNAQTTMLSNGSIDFSRSAAIPTNWKPGIWRCS